MHASRSSSARVTSASERAATMPPIHKAAMARFENEPATLLYACCGRPWTGTDVLREIGIRDAKDQR